VVFQINYNAIKLKKYDVILMTSSNCVTWNTSSKWSHKNFPFFGPPPEESSKTKQPVWV